MPDTMYAAFRDEMLKIAMSPSGQALNLRANSGLKNMANSAKRWANKAPGLGKGVSEVAEDAAVMRKATPFAQRAAKKLGLLKNAGEMQGYSRIGRKPISIERMLERESEITGLPEDFPKLAMKVSKDTAKALAMLGTGGAAALTGRQVNEDRKIGRMVRKQQAQQ